MISATIEKYGELDVLFNNAGIELTGRVEDPDEGDWDSVININLKGISLCSKYAIPQMIEQGSGVIINTASIAGLFELANEAAYWASKGGIVALTKAMAIYNAPNSARIK